MVKKMLDLPFSHLFLPPEALRFRSRRCRMGGGLFPFPGATSTDAA